MSEGIQWHILVPVRGGSASKTRLMGGGFEPETRLRLAQAFASDVVTAALATPDVVGLTVITRDPDTARHFSNLGASIFKEAFGVGLNRAVSAASDHVARLHPGRGIAVLMGDIPGLTSDALAQALTQAAKLERGVLADFADTGTVLLTSTGVSSFAPAYGEGSYARHVAAGHVPIIVPADSPLKRDVDTPGDLATARDLGLGPYTSGLLIDTERQHQRLNRSDGEHS